MKSWFSKLIKPKCFELGYNEKDHCIKKKIQTRAKQFVVYVTFLFVLLLTRNGLTMSGTANIFSYEILFLRKVWE